MFIKKFVLAGLILLLLNVCSDCYAKGVNDKKTNENAFQSVYECGISTFQYTGERLRDVGVVTWNMCKITWKYINPSPYVNYIVQGNNNKSE